ncbi:hypothetical protein ACFO1B_42665 [Dactylosporangium siamense]|uniref:Uncharacterized protein n=1 Tax=Dactylosporangium siamense TaxID=685454 RepID=A0A919UH05_9ACTN|nr:hypothetical protein [Dactylosporangium siamense]GIG51130.1 hypothetical protein Dsi01nite_091710 [Dactylosporangium siamense]
MEWTELTSAASDSDGRISVDELQLSAIEIDLLRAGLLQWGGPANAPNEFAVAMGFSDATSMVSDCMQIRRSLGVDGALTPRDWTRALLALELAFASDLVGAGYEWSTTTGLSDEGTVQSLRSVQRKLAGIVFPAMRGGALRPARDGAVE